MPKGVYPRKQEDKDRISKWMLNRYSNGDKIGFQKNNELGYLGAGIKHLTTMKEGNHKWQGDNASYCSKHKWVIYNYGKAKECQNLDCNYNKIPKRYEWANISGEYYRDRNDFVQLCPSCHRMWDAGTINIKLKPELIGISV